MPAYVLFKHNGGLGPIDQVKQCTKDLIHRVKDNKSYIEVALEHTFTDPPIAAKVSADKYKHPCLKLFDSEDCWVVKELKGGEQWKRSNILFIISSMTSGEAVLKVAKIMSTRAEQPLHKECLITVGATAEFEELIQAALEPENLKLLKDHGFTTINFQCGKSLNTFHEFKPEASGLDLIAFAFNREGLHEEIKACKEVPGRSAKGLAISHAGAGTILDVMRMGVPLIVVPNPSLLDNHQEELAIELERQGYVTHSDVKGLGAAIEKACASAKKAWGHENVVHGVGVIANEVLGYEQDAQAREG